LGSKDVTKYVFVVGGCDKVPDCETNSYKTEEAMIKGFIKRFLEIDPDIVTGYNIMGFDCTSTNATEISGTSSTCWKWGGSNQIVTNETPSVEHCLSSSALGDNVLKYIHMPGRILTLAQHCQ
jgi:DNA polymerase delta subunit 1